MPFRESELGTARRRMVSEPAEEVSLDEVTLIDEARERMEMADRTPEPTSLAPLAMDASESAPINVPITRGPTERPKRSRAPMVISLMALAVGVSAGAFVQRGVRNDARAAAAARTAHVERVEEMVEAPVVKIEAKSEAAPAKVEAAAAPAEAPAIPQMDVAALPKSKQGTVVGLADHRLWIDGKLAQSFTALVDCGPHLVQVGSAGTARTVLVPCGDEIKATP